MITNYENEVTSKFFGDFPFDRGWLRSVLVGEHGQLIVDDVTSPSVMILSSNCRIQISFIFGDPKLDTVPDVVKRYLDAAVQGQQRYLSLPSAQWEERLSHEFADRFMLVPRVSYEFTDPRLRNIIDWKSGLPPDFTVRQIDLGLAYRIAAEVDPDFIGLWSSPEQFMAQGVGYCLTHGSTLVSVAYSGYPVSEETTIAVATRADFRGRSFAFSTCAALIEYFVLQGIEPTWTTGGDNVAAKSLAKRLGFVQASHHTWLCVTGSN